MYAFMKGTVAQLFDDSLALDVGGVGYEIFAPTGTLSRLSEGKEAVLYTHLVVKEDEMSLFGFLSRRRRPCFGG